MAIDKNLLIELYSIALEEARNHAQAYTQTWIAAVVIAGAAFGTLAFLFKEASPVFKGSMMWIFIGLGFLIGLFFYHSIAYHSVEGTKCREKAKEIGLILSGKMDDKTPELQELLITEIMTEFRSPKERRAYTVLVTPPSRLFWFFIPVGFWISLCLFLGGQIG